MERSRPDRAHVHRRSSPNSREAQAQYLIEETSSREEAMELAVLQGQLHLLQQRVSETANSEVRLQLLEDRQAKEKEEWRECRKSLERQLSRGREECQRLKKEAQAGVNNIPMITTINHDLYRTLSSQSLPTHALGSFTGHSNPSPPSSLQDYPLHSKMKPIALSPLTSPYNAPNPLANSTVLDHSNSNLSSIKSSQSALDHNSHNYILYHRHRAPSSTCSLSGELRRTCTPPVSTSHDLPRSDAGRGGSPTVRFGTTSTTPRPQASGVRSDPKSTTLPVSPSFLQRSSSVGGDVFPGATSPEVELHRANAKIKQLQREVTIQDQLLSDKSRSSQRHVEELVLLRTQLAQEKASLAILRQEAHEQVAREVDKIRHLHAWEAGEVETRLQCTEEERRKVEQKLASVRCEVQGKESECARLHEEVLSLEVEVGKERESRAKMVSELQVEMDNGSSRVTQMEGALRQCQAEVAVQVARIEQEAAQHAADLRQAKREMEVLSDQMKHKDTELAGKTEILEHLQRDSESLKVEFQIGRAAWHQSEEVLSERLQQCEAARDSLLQQLSKTGHKLDLQSAKVKKVDVEVAAELAICHGEVQRLVGVVQNKQVLLSRAEGEVEKLKEEVRRMVEERSKAMVRLEEGEKRWNGERERVGMCEEEGQRLREEVGRLSEELLRSQRRLQEELEKKAEREREGEETLAHLQQELGKRAQQVLEMDRLLQGHQADTTARRLQLERNLARQEGEVKSRTRAVEELTSRASEDSIIIKDLRDQLAQFRENQRNLFSGSQIQLLSKDARLVELEVQLKEADSALRDREGEVERLGEEERRRREELVRCGELQGQLDMLTQENQSLRTSHKSEVQRLLELHMSQLSSREEQVHTHRDQLQHLTLQNKGKVEELARYRSQVTSLSAELSAERQVAEELRGEVLAAEAESCKYQAEVENLKTLSQSQRDKDSTSLNTTPIRKETTSLNSWQGTNNSLSTIPVNSVQANSMHLGSNAMLSNHHHHTTTPIPTSVKSTPIPKGSIINV